MSKLTEATNEFSRINSTVVGCHKNGIVIEKHESYHALSLSDALVAMNNGEDAMHEALENKTVDLGNDFEF